MEIYEMIEVEKVPESRRGRREGKWVNQLRGFVKSDMMQAKIQLPPREAQKAYSGLVQACRRPEFKDKVKVLKNNKDVYLIFEGRAYSRH